MRLYGSKVTCLMSLLLINRVKTIEAHKKQRTLFDVAPSISFPHLYFLTVRNGPLSNKFAVMFDLFLCLLTYNLSSISTWWIKSVKQMKGFFNWYSSSSLSYPLAIQGLLASGWDHAGQTTTARDLPFHPHLPWRPPACRWAPGLSLSCPILSELQQLQCRL